MEKDTLYFGDKQIKNKGNTNMRKIRRGAWEVGCRLCFHVACLPLTQMKLNFWHILFVSQHRIRVYVL